MRSLATGLTLVALYALCVAAAAWAARFLESPIPRRWLLLLALAPVLFLWQGFLLGRTPVPANQAYLTVPSPDATPTNVWANDVARQLAPWAQAVRLAWRDGELPHRNRWNGCGMALGANGQSAAYSPLTLAGLILPLPAAFTLWVAVRLFLALCGTWLWLGALGVSRGTSLFGAVALSFSFSMTAWLAFPLSAALGLWPMILWTIERLREPRVADRAFVLLTALFFLLPLTGHTETAASMGAFTSSGSPSAGSAATARGQARWHCGSGVRRCWRWAFRRSPSFRRRLPFEIPIDSS